MICFELGSRESLLAWPLKLVMAFASGSPSLRGAWLLPFAEGFHIVNIGQPGVLAVVKAGVVEHDPQRRKDSATALAQHMPWTLWTQGDRKIFDEDSVSQLVRHTGPWLLKK